MKKHLLFVLLLSACQPWGMNHTPSLSVAPRDQSRFASDLDFCRHDMLRRMKVAEEKHKEDVVLFGPAQLAIQAAADKTGDDYYKSQSTIIDECMTSKGYKIAN